jgi:DNA-binding CsgD family transcriptional regulator
MLTHLQVLIVKRFWSFFALLNKKGSNVSQKPIIMEQLKQILQLKADGTGIREIAKRIGISRNSVRKYLQLLEKDTDNLTSKELADKAYNHEALYNTPAISDQRVS